MSKNLSISLLMDFYGQMLTVKQYDTLDLYYNQDFSLAEIGDELNISRQGVRDSIKRGEKQLFEFEDNLGLAKKFTELSNDFSDIDILIKKITEKNKSSELTDDLTELQIILDKIRIKL